METMDDFKDELEASFRQIREGDIITGTVIAVSEEEITLDLKYYAQGIIKVEDFSNDPDFAVLEQIHAGDEIEATVVKTDDGQGNILLSRKEANDVLAWEKLQQMMEDGTGSFRTLSAATTSSQRCCHSRSHQKCNDLLHLCFPPKCKFCVGITSLSR